MRKETLAVLGAFGLAATLTLHPAADAQAEARGPLRVVKRATAPYRDVARAEADGFVPTSPCSPLKGVHYLRSVAEGQEDLEVTRPNALVYVPRADGALELLGIEYVSRTPATLFGQDFERSSAVGYYTLHVWLWQDEPEDLFAADNPVITCEV